MAVTAPYSPKAIANAFLQQGFNEKKPIGHMKLQKLVYLAHGYYLALTKGTPLIDEPFEAWDYGPVCRSLYQEFRDAGREPITHLAMEFDWDGTGDAPVPAPTNDPQAQRVIDFVFKSYADKSPFILSDLTHKAGWAWDQTRKDDVFKLKNKDINNDLIEKDFSPLVKSKAA